MASRTKNVLFDHVSRATTHSKRLRCDAHCTQVASAVVSPVATNAQKAPASAPAAKPVSARAGVLRPWAMRAALSVHFVQPVHMYSIHWTPPAIS